MPGCPLACPSSEGKMRTFIPVPKSTWDHFIFPCEQNNVIDVASSNKITENHRPRLQKKHFIENCDNLCFCKNDEIVIELDCMTTKKLFA